MCDAALPSGQEGCEFCQEDLHDSCTQSRHCKCEVCHDVEELLEDD